MASEKWTMRKKVIIDWANSKDCPKDMKDPLIEQWSVEPKFPSFEKAVWTSTRSELKDIPNNPLGTMKNIDSVRLEMGDDLIGLERHFVAIHDQYGKHLLQRGKGGVHAPFDSSTHYAEVMVNEVLSRKRKA